MMASVWAAISHTSCWAVALPAHCARPTAARSPAIGRTINAEACILRTVLYTSLTLRAHAMQSEAMGVPTMECGISDFHGLERLGVSVDWRGKLVAPDGLIDSEGCVTLPGSGGGGGSGRPSLDGAPSIASSVPENAPAPATLPV